MSKRLFSSLLMVAFMLAATSMFTSCKDYDDDIARLQEQIDANAKAIDQIRSLITDGSVITSVNKVGDGIEVTLSNGNKYTVTNGTDAAVWTIGEDGYWYQNGEKTQYYALGKDGKNAPVWTIGADGYWYNDGVKTDIKAVGLDADKWTIGTDGYWYLNGEKTNYKAVGTDGTNGTNGNNGTNGADGAAGIYYVPNPDTGNFDIYNGDGTFKEHTNISWKATSSNVITAVMDDSDLKLYNVQLGEGYTTVSIALSNALRGFVFKPELYVDGVPAIRVTSFKYKAMTGTGLDSKNESWKEGSQDSVINPPTYAYYHVNPTNANVEDLKNLKFVVSANSEYEAHRLKDKASDNFAVTATYADFKDGILKVKVDVKGTAATNEHISVVALQTTKSNNENVTSDYATIVQKEMNGLRIADKKLFAQGEDYHFRRYINALDNEAGEKVRDQRVWTDNDVNGETCDLLMVYSEPLDVMAHVEAHELLSPHEVAPIGELGMHFELDIVKNYKIGTNVTEQGEYVEWTDNSKQVLRVKDIYNTSAIDRTPIIRVKLMHGNKVVKVAYIKVKIVRPDVVIVNPSFPLVVNKLFEFKCDVDPDFHTINYKEMSQYVYAHLNLSKTEFHNLYTDFRDVVMPNDIGTVVEVPDAEDIETATDLFKWSISKEDLWKYAGQEVTNVIRYYVNSDPNCDRYVEIKLTANIKNINKTIAVDQSKYIDQYWNSSKTLAHFNVEVPRSDNDDNPNNCVFDNDLNSPFVTKDGVIDVNLPYSAKFVYTFCEDMDRKASPLSGHQYRLSSDRTKLYLDNTNSDHLIATIYNNVAGAPKANYVVLNKQGEWAKKILNLDDGRKLEVEIQAVGYACGETNKPLTITFNGNKCFHAVFVRPVSLENVGQPGNFIDGVDVGETGSFINFDRLFVPKDWRGRLFSNPKYDNYWGYYGPFQIQLDPDAVVRCTLAGLPNRDSEGYAPLPETIVLQVVNATTYHGETSKFGFFLTYKNNGTVLQEEFKLKVPFVVNYGWGAIKHEVKGIKVYPTSQVPSQAPRK